MNEEEYVKPTIVVPLGDMHWGYAPVNVEKFEKVIKYIEDYADYWIGMGDYIDCTTPYSRHYEFERRTMNVQEQIVSVANYFRPIADKCLGLLYGNHEHRLRKTEIDPVVQIAELIGRPELPVKGVFLQKINGYTVFATHGVTSSVKKSYKINKLMELSKIYHADIYLMGHVHELDVVKDLFIDPEGNFRERTFAFTGHFIEYKNSYAQELLYSPTPVGCNAFYLEKGGIFVERIV